MLKIAITGPESSGKTTLTRQLARHYQVNWVPEFAREYLDQLGRAYRREDLRRIAEGQIKLEQEAASQAGRLLLSDTELTVIKVWSDFKYGAVDPWIAAQHQQQQYDLYLLCKADITWEFDPLRESPLDRPVLYFMYKRELKQLNARFIEMEGSEQERLHTAIGYIDQLLSFQSHII